MQTAVISVVRDEADIIGAWLDHAEALFDFVYIADHASSDGTYEYLAARARTCPSIRLFRYTEGIFDKIPVLQLLRALVIDDTHAEWLFVLDGDEFLPYGSATEFKSALSSAGAIDVLLYPWLNCYPASPGPIHVPFQAYVQRHPSKFGKVALRRKIAADPSYLIPVGAHDLQHETGRRVAGSHFGEIYHIPLRSLEQAWDKLLTGTSNRLRILQRDPRNSDSRHYPPQLNLLLARPTWQTVAALVLDYGDRAAAHRKTGSSEDVAEKFSLQLLRFPGGTPRGLPAPEEAASCANSESLPLRELVKKTRYRRLVEEMMSLDRGGSLGRITDFHLLADNELKHLADFGARTFERLDEGQTTPLTFSDVFMALQAAFLKIGHPVQSAWGEHVPFMFSLIALLKPRRFVELGVHNGGSFLAACQAVKHYQLETTCVAVDNWVGDVHAGFHDTGVFQKFRGELVKEYAPFAGYICRTFDEAAQRFAPASVDLLHIDGLHTAEAVRHDFETWRDMLSSRGVVLFHDTNEFRDDFGVWRFWRDIRDQYPHLEFGHGHGLGILVVGEENPLRKPVDGWETSLVSPQASDLLQVLFNGIGQLAWSAARAAPVKTRPKTRSRSPLALASRELQRFVRRIRSRRIP